MIKTIVSISTAVVMLATGLTSATAADVSKEARNLINFDLVDFVGWNNPDYDVLRTYHSHDVVVESDVDTHGIDPHMAFIEQALVQLPVKITQHWPKVAEGDWTCVGGITTNPDFTMATVAKWPAEGGGMVEERLYFKRLTADEIKAIDVSKADFTVTTPDDATLRASTGAGAGAGKGWYCAIVGDTVIFSHTEDGKVVEQIGYAVP